MMMLSIGQYEKIRNLRIKIRSLSGYEALVVHLRIGLEESLHF